MAASMLIHINASVASAINEPDPEQNRDASIDHNRTKTDRCLPEERSKRNASEPHPKGDPSDQHHFKSGGYDVGVHAIRSSHALSARMPESTRERNGEDAEYQHHRVPHRSNASTRWRRLQHMPIRVSLSYLRIRWFHSVGW